MDMHLLRGFEESPVSQPVKEEITEQFLAAAEKVVKCGPRVFGKEAVVDIENTRTCARRESTDNPELSSYWEVPIRGKKKIGSEKVTGYLCISKHYDFSDGRIDCLVELKQKCLMGTYTLALATGDHQTIADKVTKKFDELAFG